MLAEEEVDDSELVEQAPAMCWRKDAPVLFERFQLRENTEYLVDITLPATATDLGRQDRPKGWPFVERLGTVFKADPPRRWRENADGSTTISGLLRLRSHAGILDLSLAPNAPLKAEVVCRKIGYLDEFRALLDDVAEELSELLLQFDSPVSAGFNLADVTAETEAALLFQLRHIMAERNLPVALDEIRRSFHTHLHQRRSIEDIGSVQTPDVAAFIEECDPAAMVAGGPFAKLFRGYSPREFPVSELRESSDTPENRYVKSFLEELVLMAQRLALVLESRGKAASLREVKRWIASLDEELSSGIWRSIGQLRTFPSNSQVLQKRRGYREVLKFDISLRMGLELPWKRARHFADGLVGDIRPVSELYEYWCFFLLKRTLTELAEAELPHDGSLIDVSRTGLQVRLQRGKRSRTSYIYRQTASRTLKVNLFYNRLFPRPTKALGIWYGSYTAKFDPDYSIEIITEGAENVQRQWLHFDAKYRLESVDFGGQSDLDDSPEDEASSSDYEVELARIYRQDDLFKMHTYRDGILSSRGAYILFPGDGTSMNLTGKRQNLYVRHPTAFSGAPGVLFPSVGAFDLCPGRDAVQRPIIREFLKSVFDSAFLRSAYQEETGYF
ncbi:DUF2357 domain-containing protein [Aestuariivirga sp.]|uniref:DUF2357 domain-containing protein n=1 Tax=Aestuariivirga sp. TaxID=2650926 RepID=UPI00391DD804